MVVLAYFVSLDMTWRSLSSFLCDLLRLLRLLRIVSLLKGIPWLEVASVPRLELVLVSQFLPW